MKNIEIFQQFKKDHHALKTEDGQFLYKLFHTPEQILPFTPLESPAVYDGNVERKCSFLIYPVE
jgi:hypothetical protein